MCHSGNKLLHTFWPDTASFGIFFSSPTHLHYPFLHLENSISSFEIQLKHPFSRKPSLPILGKVIHSSKLGMYAFYHISMQLLVYNSVSIRLIPLTGGILSRFSPHSLFPDSGNSKYLVNV